LSNVLNWQQKAIRFILTPLQKTCFIGTMI
jgi:hypothetical protein